MIWNVFLAVSDVKIYPAARAGVKAIVSPFSLAQNQKIQKKRTKGKEKIITGKFVFRRRTFSLPIFRILQAIIWSNVDINYH